MVSNRDNSVTVDDVVLNGVLTTLTETEEWRGTMTDLRSTLSKMYSRNRSYSELIPGSPSSLRVVLNRIANRLRTRGVSVKFGRISGGSSDGMRTRFVRFAR